MKKMVLVNLHAVVLIFFLCITGYAADLIPQADWTLWYVDSEELIGEDGAAINAFDGDINTIWHTKWAGGSPPPPHEIQIDLGATYDIDGFFYLSRQDGSINGGIADYEFYVSEDGSEWDTPVATGTFSNDTNEKEIHFAPKTGRFICLRALSEVNSAPWTSMAEINVIGNPFGGNFAPNGVITLPAGDVTIYEGVWLDFSGTGNDPDGDLPLSFLWQFGGGSGIPDSTLTDPGTVQFNNPGTYTVTFTVTDSSGLPDSTPASLTVTVLSETSGMILPQADWTLWYVDSEELIGEDGAAINAFDGDINTIWHTKWAGGSPPPPHEIQIDLGATYDIDGFFYLPRQDGSINGGIADYEFYVSEDGSGWDTPVATGAFSNDTNEKEIRFAPKTGRFICLRALSEVNSAPWTSMAEINVIGNPFGGNFAPNGVITLPAGDVTIYEGVWLDFSGTGNDPDGDLPLSFLWQFGGGSGIPDSTLTDPGTVQFNNPGTYTVTFTVTDSSGLPDSTPASLTVTVLVGSTEELIPDWTNIQFAPFNLIEPPNITNPVLTAADVSDVAASFVADPFIFHENDTWYMFFEVLVTDANRGDIGLATSSDGLLWNYEQIVLSEDGIHHSYPFVLKHNSKYYMMPESNILGEVRLYEASNFPYNWNYVSTIATDKSFVDASIFHYNDMWWMFVGDTSNSNCYLYYSYNLLAGWTEHPMSPIVSGDASKARPAGRSIVFQNNRIVRMAQKSDTYYGQQVRAFEVDVLNETEYAEHEIPESPILLGDGSGWNASGMHHFDPWWTGDHWLSAVDGVGSGVWSIGIYIAENQSAPNGVITLPSGDVTIYEGDWLDCSGTGNDPDGDLPLSFLWQFGGGSGIPDSTVTDPGPVQFNNPGTYTVTFTVTDSSGLPDSTPASLTVTVLSETSGMILPQADWILWYVDSEELIGEDGAAINAFDGDINTIWHTKWAGGSPPPPHEIQIDLGATYDIDGFFYLPRQDGSINGGIADYEFYVSEDGSGWDTPVATGTFSNDTNEKEIHFAPKTGRFICLRALSEVNSAPWTSMAEINVIGNP